MIREVIIRRFKRFDEVTFSLPDHVVVAGPNNTGKTTLLQAIAAWSLALNRWCELNDYNRRRGYAQAPLARQAFSAVPLRSFDLLWTRRAYRDPIEIEIAHRAGWRVAMELIPDSTEQIYVRPRSDADGQMLSLGLISLTPVFVPAMSGLSTEEPVYTRPKQDQLLGQGKPGEILRNLLVEANQTGALERIRNAIDRLFHVDILPPDSRGASIVAEYTETPNGPRLDIASAGSGLQQVLMLLAFLHTRPASVLLLDEPDAHLHVILQDAIYGELRSVAAANRSQLIIATHSEVIIESVDPRELCVMLGAPKLLSTTDERTQLIQSLGVLTHTDIMVAEGALGVLYVDDYTDMDVLRAWARVLDHPALELLTTKLLWKARIVQQRAGAKGIQAKDHFDALQLVRPELPGLQLLDGDAQPGPPPTPITGRGLQRLRWSRYEIESYLVHPVALARFVEWQLGGAPAGALAVADMNAHLERAFRPEFFSDPLNPEPLVENFLRTTKARTQILPPILDAAGLHGFLYTRYHEIAAVMTPEEIHPEVIEKLDLIVQAFPA